MVYIAYFTELDLQICANKDAFVAKIVNTRLTKFASNASFLRVIANLQN